MTVNTEAIIEDFNEFKNAVLRGEVSVNEKSSDLMNEIDDILSSSERR